MFQPIQNCATSLLQSIPSSIRTRLTVELTAQQKKVLFVATAAFAAAAAIRLAFRYCKELNGLLDYFKSDE